MSASLGETAVSVALLVPIAIMSVRLVVDAFVSTARARAHLARVADVQALQLDVLQADRHTRWALDARRGVLQVDVGTAAENGADATERLSADADADAAAADSPEQQRLRAPRDVVHDVSRVLLRSVGALRTLSLFFRAPLSRTGAAARLTLPAPATHGSALTGGGTSEPLVFFY